MKTNKTILIILVTIILTASITTLINKQTTKETKQLITITDTFTESRSDFYLESGDTAIELSDGSYAIYNETINLYTFTPATLGDWEYNLSSKSDLDSIIATYISVANTGGY